MFILKKILNLNNFFFIFILILFISLALTEYLKIKNLNKININLVNDELVINEDFEEVSLYSSAYLLGKQGEYENSIEKYNTLLKLFPTSNLIDSIYYNIAF